MSITSLSWVHDSRIAIDGNGAHFSSAGSLNREGIGRYFRYFSRVTIIGRLSHDTTPGLTGALDMPGVSFDLVDPYDTLYKYLLKAPKLRRDIRTRIQRTDCSLILMPSRLGLVAARECRRLNRPYIIQVIGCAWEGLWNHGSFAGKLIAPIAYWQTRRAVRRAPNVIYITTTFLQARYPTKGTAGNGIANVHVEVNTADLEARLARIRSRRGAAIVGLVGSLDVDYKGHETAFRALAWLVAQGVDVRLACVGTGDSARWRQLAEHLSVADRIDFLGVLPGAEAVKEWMRTLDAYIQPSTTEGHGRAILEAMSTACPAFASRVGGLPDSVPPQYLFPPKDHIRLGYLLQGVLCDVATAEEAANHCFRACGPFEWRIMRQRRDEFFQEFMETHQTRGNA